MRIKVKSSKILHTVCGLSEHLALNCLKIFLTRRHLKGMNKLNRRWKKKIKSAILISLQEEIFKQRFNNRLLLRTAKRES